MSPRAYRFLCSIGLGLALSSGAHAQAAPDDATRLVRQGSRLATLGNCTGCHTRDAEKPFAGGVPLETPFGTIYGTNITPDPATGIGTWTETDFDRAMTDGIDQHGEHLYPAFPYPHFRFASQEDLHALYAFIATRAAVVRPNQADQVSFPFDQRGLLAFWNALFRADSARIAPVDEVSNPLAMRGDYVVQSLGHCGACHTPRNALGAEDRARPLAGARTAGWYAPALNAQNPSPVTWTKKALVAYLTTGIAPDHAIAAGPMREVVASLAKAPDEDIEAIATYLILSMRNVSRLRDGAEQGARARASAPLASLPIAADATLRRGQAVYAEACADCHDAGRKAGSASALQLPLAVALYDPDPRSFLRIVREGVTPAGQSAGRVMPAFHASINDDDLAALAVFLRRAAADSPPWQDLDEAVKETRE